MFERNIGGKGRLIRGGMAAVLLMSAVVVWRMGLPAWAAAVLAAGGVFAGFEAWRGWCAARACGAKTKW